MNGLYGNLVDISKINQVEDVPVRVLTLLQAERGIGFEVNDGRVSRAVVEPSFGLRALADKSPTQETEMPYLLPAI